MELMNNIKKNLLSIAIIIILGIFTFLISVFSGSFGIAIMSFCALVACSSVLIFIIPSSIFK
jgi:uncharacterized membrane protein SpoIIM required for sporulation